MFPLCYQAHLFGGYLLVQLLIARENWAQIFHCVDWTSSSAGYAQQARLTGSELEEGGGAWRSPNLL